MTSLMVFGVYHAVRYCVVVRVSASADHGVGWDAAQLMVSVCQPCIAHLASGAMLPHIARDPQLNVYGAVTQPNASQSNPYPMDWQPAASSSTYAVQGSGAGPRAGASSSTARVKVEEHGTLDRQQEMQDSEVKGHQSQHRHPQHEGVAQQLPAPVELLALATQYLDAAHALTPQLARRPSWSHPDSSHGGPGHQVGSSLADREYDERLAADLLASYRRYVAAAIVCLRRSAQLLDGSAEVKLDLLVKAMLAEVLVRETKNSREVEGILTKGVGGWNKMVEQRMHCFVSAEPTPRLCLPEPLRYLVDRQRQSSE